MKNSEHEYVVINTIVESAEWRYIWRMKKYVNSLLRKDKRVAHQYIANIIVLMSMCKI